MAVSFLDIQANVLSQLNGLVAGTVSTAETAYAAAAAGTFTVSDRTSTDFPLPQVQAAVLDTELAIIEAICRTDAHPERADFAKTSNAINSGDSLPVTASDSTPFLGRFSAIVGATTGKELLEYPVRKVQHILENEGSMYPVRPPCYALLGHRIIFYSPDTTAKIVGPAAARTTFTGNIRCRDYHRDAIVCGALAALLTKEGAWLDAQAVNAQMWGAHLAGITSYVTTGVIPQPGETK